MHVSPAIASFDTHPRRGVTRVCRTTVNRLTKLVALTRDLRDWAVEAGGGVRFAHSVEPVLRELESMQRKLPTTAGSPDASASIEWGKPTSRPKASKSVVRLATRLLAECRACSRSACALLHKAQTVRDGHWTRLAYALVRELEKLFWVLTFGAEQAWLARPLAVVG